MLALCPLDMSMDFDLAAWEAAPCPFKHVLFVGGLAGGVGPFYNAMLKVFGCHAEFHYAVRNEAVIADGRIVGFQDLPLSVEDALAVGLEDLKVAGVEKLFMVYGASCPEEKLVIARGVRAPGLQIAVIPWCAIVDGFA